MKFDLHRLRLLRELRYRGTISAVAAALSYSPATVSEQLTQLQVELGTRLLEPDGRGVRLTPQAHILVTHTEAILDRLAEAEVDLVRSREEVVGTVRVAAFQTAMLTLIPTAITWLNEHHPALRIEVIQAESEIARSGLLPHDYDLVLDEVYPGHSLAHSEQLSQELLLADPLRLASPALLPQRDSLFDYADAPWIMEPAGSPAREWALAACRHAGFEPDIRYESTDVVVHAQLVESGHAVTFLPDLMASHKEQQIQRIKLSPKHSRRIVTTCRAVASRHPAISATREALRLAARHGSIEGTES